MCENHECNEVTSAIYLTPEEISKNNGEKYYQELLYLLALERPVKKLSPEQIEASKDKLNMITQ